MDPHQSLFYGLGIVAFSIAGADKYLQRIERKYLHRVIEDWSEEMDDDFDNTEIIFSIMQNAKAGSVISYEKGMDYIRIGNDYLSGKMQEKFLVLMKLISKALPKNTQAQETINRFRKDLKELSGGNSSELVLPTA